MGFRITSSITTTAVNVLPASAAETVIYQLPPIIIPTDSAAVFIGWNANIATALGITALRFNLRRGLTITDPLVNAAAWNVTAAPGNTYQSAGFYFDVLAAQQCYYCLTVQQIGGTVAGTVQVGELLAFAL
jgi:hypothetical protein